MHLTKLSITTAIATLLFGASFGAQPGLFAGVALGYGQLNNGQKYFPSEPELTETLTGFAYGVSAGYNFSNYFGVEGQVNRNPSLECKDSGATVLKEKLYDIDILAVGYLPINNDYFGSDFGLVGKAGVAYLDAKASTTGEWSIDGPDSVHLYRPKVAAGVSYDAIKNLSISLIYSHIFSIKGRVAVDTGTLSVNYLF